MDVFRVCQQSDFCSIKVNPTCVTQKSRQLQICRIADSPAESSSMSVFPPNCYWNKAHETGSHSKPWAPPVWDQEMVKTTGLNVRQSEHGHRERWQKKECFSCTASDSNQSSRPPYVLCKSLSCPHYPPHTLTATPPSVTWPLPVWRLLKAGLTFILVSYVSRDMNLLTSTLSSIFTILKMFKKRN